MEFMYGVMVSCVYDSYNVIVKYPVDGYRQMSKNEYPNIWAGRFAFV